MGRPDVNLAGYARSGRHLRSHPDPEDERGKMAARVLNGFSPVAAPGGGEGSSSCLPGRPVPLSLARAGWLVEGFRIGVGLEEQPGQGAGRGRVDSLTDAYHYLGVGKGGV
jgi:hypothetical protein